MSYVDDHLLPDERVTYRAHLHKLVFIVPGLVSAAFLAAATLLFINRYTAAGLIAMAGAVLPTLLAWIHYSSSEFAVTDKRVIIKVGFVQRRTLETMLGKVEAIGVDQGVIARLLDYGTIEVTGTGGTKESFHNISAPLEFRRQVQMQISEGDDETRALTGGAPRDERECPFCAERILKKARVCKHCGHEVEPVVTG